MSKTVNILGDTPKQQWLAAIGIFEMCITSNIKSVEDGLDPGYEIPEIGGEACEKLAIAYRETRNFAHEMRMLVEGVFDE